jgi:hypothetical protein
MLMLPRIARAATALNATDGSGREVISKIMVRLTLFGLLPPSILPMLVSVRLKVRLQQQSFWYPKAAVIAASAVLCSVLGFD